MCSTGYGICAGLAGLMMWAKFMNAREKKNIAGSINANAEMKGKIEIWLIIPKKNLSLSASTGRRKPARLGGRSACVAGMMIPGLTTSLIWKATTLRR